MNTIQVDYLKDDRGWFWHVKAGPSNPLGVCTVRYRTVEEAKNAMRGLSQALINNRDRGENY